MPDSRKKIASLFSSSVASRHAGSKDQNSKLDDDEERKPSFSRRLEHRASDRGEDYESDDDNDDDDDDDDDESNDDDDDDDGDDNDDDDDDDDNDYSGNDDDDDENEVPEHENPNQTTHDECAQKEGHPLSAASSKSKSKGFGKRLFGKFKKLKPDRKYQGLLAQITSLESEKAVAESKINQLQLDMSNEAAEMEKAHKERDDLKAEVSKLQLELEKAQSEMEKIIATEALEMRLCEGYLWKRGVRGPTGRNWRYRWFKAKKNGEIRYYKRDGKTKTLRGSIDVRMITEVTNLSDSEQNEENSCFNIITPDRTYEIKGIDKDEKLRWMKAIKDLIYWINKKDGKQ